MIIAEITPLERGQLTIDGFDVWYRTGMRFGRAKTGLRFVLDVRDPESAAS